MGICFGSQQRFVKQHPHMHATQPGPPQPSWPTTAHTGQQNLYKAPGGSLYCTATGPVPATMSWLAAAVVASAEGLGAANTLGFADGGPNEIESDPPASFAALN